MRAAALALVLFVSQPGDTPELQMLDDWIQAVDQHVAGERDQALARIAKWSAEELEVFRAYVQAFVDLPLDTRERSAMRRWLRDDLPAIRSRAKEVAARGAFDEFRKRAAMLHTDTAILASVPREVAAPVARTQKPRWRRDEPQPGVDVMSYDGRVEHFRTANPHWQFAMDLLESLPAVPRRDPMVAQWYRAIGAHFAYEHNYADASRHFARARRIVPDDPAVLFAEACYQETLGSPPNQNFVRVTTLPNGLRVMGVDRPQEHFKRAEAMLTRALAAQPGFVDARLRLGRVLAELGQYDAALPHLRQVIAESKDRALTYYGHLFTGDATLALGRAEESRVAYQRALELQPHAQAARLGLGAALRTLGNRAAALDAVLPTLTSEPHARDSYDEPWWEYYEGDAANVDRLLAELRAPFRKARP